MVMEAEMMKLILATLVAAGLISSTLAYAGGTEQDTSAGNAPAAESGGSGR